MNIKGTEPFATCPFCHASHVEIKYETCEEGILVSFRCLDCGATLPKDFDFKVTKDWERINDLFSSPKDKEGAPIFIGDLVYLFYDRNSLYKVEGYDGDDRVKVSRLSPKGKDIRYGCGELFTHQTPPYLRPCPFCGGDATLAQSSIPKTWFARCERCHVTMLAGETHKAAAKAWNKREGEE